MEAPETIRDFVHAVSNGDGESAGQLVTEDAQFRLPGDRELPPGESGARAFAAQHAEADGRKPSAELVSAERSGDKWVVSLRFMSREVSSDEVMFEMTVGGVFTLDGDRISAMHAFPSYEEAVSAASQ